MNWIGFDFETSGVRPEYALQPWRIPSGEAWATSFVAIDPGAKREWGGLAPSVGVMREVLEYAAANDRRLVGWNTAFDISVLIAYGLNDLVRKAKWLDGMLLWKHVAVEPEYELARHKRKAFDLKSCVAELLPQHAGYEDDVDFHATDLPSLRKLHEYNRRDVGFTLHCARHWWRKLNSRQQRVAMIEADALPQAAWANYEGLIIDTLAGAELRAHLAAEAQDRLAELQGLDPTVTPQVLASPIQLAALLFDRWGLPVTKVNVSKLTGKQSRSTDKEVMFDLAALDPRVKLIHDYRRAVNSAKKFAEQPLASARYNGDGRARPQARVFSTYTSRLTFASQQKGTEPNKRGTGVRAVMLPIGWAIHQEQREAIYRDLVVAPPGYEIVEFDAAGQEFRWMAIASGDETMLHLCQPGEDAHAFMGARVAGRDYHELQAALAAEDETIRKAAKGARQSGKVANLCCIAGTPILTNRGYVAIQDVRRNDLVWDGIEFVAHEGVVCSGTKPVMTYAGLTATPDHQVLIGERWERLDEAARHGWAIEPALGRGWACKARAAVRIVGGIVRQAVAEMWGDIRARALRLWDRAREQPCILGGWAIDLLQGVRHAGMAQARGSASDRRRNHEGSTQACAGMGLKMRKSERQIMGQLRGARGRISVQVYVGGAGVGAGEPAAQKLLRGGHRPDRQQRPLRAGEPSACNPQQELEEQANDQSRDMAGREHPDHRLGRKSVFADMCHALCGAGAFWRRYSAPGTAGCFGEAEELAGYRGEAPVYDIVNCGPRTRFAANGLIVHNSLQYRTSARRLFIVSRVQHGMNIGMGEAERIWETYRRTYVGVPRYWSRQIARAKQAGYVENIAGRRVQMHGRWDGPLGWSMESTAVNYPIQSIGGDQKYLALACMKNILVDFDARLAWELHDGVYYFVPQDRVRDFIAAGRRVLNNLPYRQAWGFTPPIPLPWDAKSGPTWGSLKEVQFDD